MIVILKVIGMFKSNKAANFTLPLTVSWSLLTAHSMILSRKALATASERE